MDGNGTHLHSPAVAVPACPQPLAGQSAEATISNLQNEWNTHMLAMEQVLALAALLFVLESLFTRTESTSKFWPFSLIDVG